MSKNHYELDKGYHEEGATPQLNEQGEQYLKVWGDCKFFDYHKFPAEGGLTLVNAKKVAKSIVKEIEWDIN